MLYRLSIIQMTIFTVAVLSVGILAQNKATAEAATKSLLTATALPKGAVKLKSSEMPEEVRKFQAELLKVLNLFAQGERLKYRFRQGDSEVFSWAGIGNDKAESDKLKKKLESDLTTAGWSYEAQDGELSSFKLEKTKPALRKIMGFFISREKSLILTLMEVVRDETQGAAVVDVTGKWNLIGKALGQSIPATLELKQDGEIVSGTFSSHLGGGAIREIKVNGNKLDAVAKVEVNGQIVELKLDGTVNDDAMNGTLSGKGLPPISFTATKAK